MKTFKFIPVAALLIQIAFLIPQIGHGTNPKTTLKKQTVAKTKVIVTMSSNNAVYYLCDFGFKK